MPDETEEERKNARERIWGETVDGAEVAYADGTRTVGRKVVKVGSLAIVENGEIIGWKQEAAS